MSTPNYVAFIHQDQYWYENDVFEDGTAVLYRKSMSGTLKWVPQRAREIYCSVLTVNNIRPPQGAC